MPHHLWLCPIFASARQTGQLLGRVVITQTLCHNMLVDAKVDRVISRTHAVQHKASFDILS